VVSNLAARPFESPTIQAEIPLVADLDGTIVRTDLLLESWLALLKQNPFYFLLLPLWLLRGKAFVKREIARRVELDATLLPYRMDLLEYLKRQRVRGRSIVLATASDALIAQRVADHLGLFDAVFASDGSTNLSGGQKRDRLVEAFGDKGFDYAGNDSRDLPVWRSARQAVVVGRERRLHSRMARKRAIDCDIAPDQRSWCDLLKPLRLEQWLKNLLVFVPLFAAHRVLEASSSVKTLLAFAAFGCCASAGYVLNDLLDLAADRRHPEKRHRPFAAGDLPLAYGLIMIPVLAAIGSAIAILVSPLFLGMLWIYAALTATYSFSVRRVVLLDVIFLAGLYTMRVMAGAVAISVWPTQWLLAFSTFLFLSLALVKRYGELVIMKRLDGEQAHSRSYELSDSELLAAMGSASGYAAVLVLALYIESDIAHDIYGRPRLIWFLCPLMLYWISHIWLIAHRGKMPGDPLVFATRDRVSRILIGLMIAITLIAL
jgi:4-hydroxybenzoate polyprenyltransferase